jgi:hypothetical protein
MNESPRDLASREAARSILAHTTPADFDGHTEFERMTPAQRLEWLDLAVQFIQDAKGRQPLSTPGQH